MRANVDLIRQQKGSDRTSVENVLRARNENDTPLSFRSRAPGSLTQPPSSGLPSHPLILRVRERADHNSSALPPIGLAQWMSPPPCPILAAELPMIALISPKFARTSFFVPRPPCWLARCFSRQYSRPQSPSRSPPSPSQAHLYPPPDASQCSPSPLRHLPRRHLLPASCAFVHQPAAHHQHLAPPILRLALASEAWQSPRPLFQVGPEFGPANPPLRMA